MTLFRSEENCTQNTKAMRKCWRDEEQRNGENERSRETEDNAGLGWNFEF